MSLTRQIPQGSRVGTKQTNLAATATSTITNFPVGYAAYDIYFNVGTGTGTSPTLDILVSVSYDGGTTFVGVVRSAQFTGTAATHIGRFQNGLAAGGSAVNAAAGLATTGGASTTNFAVTPNIKVTYTVGGTNPSFATAEVWIVPLNVRITY